MMEIIKQEAKEQTGNKRANGKQESKRETREQTGSKRAI
jgi:hypothetical protein